MSQILQCWYRSLVSDGYSTFAQHDHITFASCFVSGGLNCQTRIAKRIFFHRRQLRCAVEQQHRQQRNNDIISISNYLQRHGGDITQLDLADSGVGGDRKCRPLSTTCKHFDDSWVQIILRSKNEELQVQAEKLSKAEALLGQALDQQVTAFVTNSGMYTPH